MPQLRGNYKLAKKEILTVWEADYPQKPLFPTSRRGNYYVGTQELLRRDVGKWASREERNRRWNRLELGFEGDIGREHGERSERGKRAKGQKSHLTKVKKWKWKGEYWTRWMMNEMNDERGEWGEQSERGEWWIWWICPICECDFSKNRNETNPKYHITIIKYQDY